MYYLSQLVYCFSDAYSFHHLLLNEITIDKFIFRRVQNMIDIIIICCPGLTSAGNSLVHKVITRAAERAWFLLQYIIHRFYAKGECRFQYPRNLESLIGVKMAERGWPFSFISEHPVRPFVKVIISSINPDSTAVLKQAYKGYVKTRLK